MLNAINELTRGRLKISKREKMLLIIFLFLIGCYISYSYYFKNQIEKIKLLHTELMETRELVIDARKRSSEDVTAIQEAITQVEHSLAELDQRIPYYKDTPGMLVKLYQLTTKYNLCVLNGVSFSEIKKHDGYASYFVNLSVSGRSPDVYWFMHDLEQMSRLVEIEEMLFHKTNDQVQCALKVEVFVLEEVRPDPLQYSFQDLILDSSLDALSSAETSSISAEALASSEAEIEENEQRVYLKKSYSRANIRKEPSLNAPILTKCYPDTEMVLLDTQKPWYKIRLSDGRVAWIHEIVAEIR